jgi:hypothetical protein
MAITNQDRIGRSMGLLRAGFSLYIDSEIQSVIRLGTVRRNGIMKKRGQTPFP